MMLMLLLLMMMMMMMRRIRVRVIERSGPRFRNSPTSTSTRRTIVCDHTSTTAATTTTTTTAAIMRGHSSTSSPPNEQTVTVSTVSFKQNDITSIESLLLNIAAPAFGQHVALAAVPIRVAESPALSRLVLETQQQPLVA